MEPTAEDTDAAALAVAARHALHDEALVVALAAATLDPTEEAADIERARGLVDRCAACQSLHDDIASIGAAIRTDARGTITAPRDYRLTADDARRLGGFVRVDGFITRLRRSMASFARPLGASMATLGVVGLLVGSVSLAGGVGVGSLEYDNHLTQRTAAPVSGSAAGATDTPKATDGRTAFGPASPLVTDPESETGRDEALFSAPGPNQLLVGGSAVLLVAGVLVFLMGFRRRSNAGTAR